jgi:hypothetical protein
VQRVYVETTIPSAYWEERPQPEMVARRNWTRRWWDEERIKYEAVTGSSVIEELSEGTHPRQAEKLALADALEVMPMCPEVIEIVGVYLAHKLMPADPGGDAAHLALASFYNCDMLLTWNCAHLANPSKARHITRINAMIGLMVPQLITPLELLNEDPYE